MNTIDKPLKVSRRDKGAPVTVSAVRTLSNNTTLNKGGSLSTKNAGAEEPPAIFTLPQNPMAFNYFKYNFVRNKIE
jgi:hypothetical protein